MLYDFYILTSDFDSSENILHQLHTTLSNQGYLNYYELTLKETEEQCHTFTGRVKIKKHLAKLTDFGPILESALELLEEVLELEVSKTDYENSAFRIIDSKKADNLVILHNSRTPSNRYTKHKIPKKHPSNITGQAFEYICVKMMQEKLEKQYKCKVKLENESDYQKTKNRFNLLSDEIQIDFIKAANYGIKNVLEKEDNLKKLSGQKVVLALTKSDYGSHGDVRDILLVLEDKTEIGISCKVNNSSCKHPGLDLTNDFINTWTFGKTKMNDKFFTDIAPVYQKLSKFSQYKLTWSDIPEQEKKEYYQNIRDNLILELEKLKEAHSSVIENMFLYFIGNKDYYKIIGNIKVNQVINQKFNVSSNLPSKIIDVNYKEGSYNSLAIYFDNGYAISLRIHNRDKLVRPSFKLDAKIIKSPHSETFVYEW